MARKIILEKQKKRLSIFDWVLVKTGLMFLILAVVSAYQNILTFIEWYWWFVFSIVCTIPLIELLIQHKKQKSGTVETFRIMKREFSTVDWALSKIAVMFFWIGVSDLFPMLPNLLAWYWWAALWIITLISILYFIWYYAPLTEKNPTELSRLRKRYSRRQITKRKKAN
jgi:hypothetical protein